MSIWIRPVLCIYLLARRTVEPIINSRARFRMRRRTERLENTYTHT